MGTALIRTRTPRTPPPMSFPDGMPRAYAYKSKPIRIGVLQEIMPYVQRFVFPKTLRLQRISLGIDGADDTMTVSWQPDITLLATEHIAHITELLMPGQTLGVAAAARPVVAVIDGTMRPKGAAVLFNGIPLAGSIQWSPDAQSVTFECVSQAQDAIRHGAAHQITGRIMRTHPEIDWTDTVPELIELTTFAAVFNEYGKRNRSAEALPMDFTGGTVEIFQFVENDSIGSEYWSYADALRYVVYHYGYRPIGHSSFYSPINVHAFMSDTDRFVTERDLGGPDPFVRNISRRCDDDVSVQSCNIDEALGILCQRARLHYNIDYDGSANEGSLPNPLNSLRVFGHIATADATTDPNGLQEQPAPLDIPRDAPFQDYDSAREAAEATAAQASMLTIDGRFINKPVFLGGHIEHEVTLLMRPGWYPVYEQTVPGGAILSLDNIPPLSSSVPPAKTAWLRQFRPEYSGTSTHGDAIPTSVYHGEHPDHWPYADVFRLWLFPDTAELFREVDDGTGEGVDVPEYERLGRTQGVWTAARYNPFGNDGRNWWDDPVYGAGINATITGSWTPRRRPLLDTVGRASLSTSQTTPVVRIHFGDGTRLPPAFDDDGWRDFSGNVEIDSDYCAIRFTDANIYNAPPFLLDPTNPHGENAIRRYIDGEFWVSVTACIRSDSRMKCEPVVTPTTSFQRAQVIDLGFERFQERWRTSGNSHLNARPLFTEMNSAYTERIDTPAFLAFANELTKEMQHSRAAGVVSIPWFSTDGKLGDVATGIAGLGLAFNNRPIMTRRGWIDTGTGVRTEWVFTDLRHNPELR